MAQSVKCLPHKHKNLTPSLEPTFEKKWTARGSGKLVIPVLGSWILGSCWIPKDWDHLLCYCSGHVSSDSNWQWCSDHSKHLWFPSSHTHVLLPGQPLFPGYLLHNIFCPFNIGEPNFKEKKHFFLWLCSADVLWICNGINRMFATWHDGFWSLRGHLQPSEILHHHEQRSVCVHGIRIMVLWQHQFSCANIPCHAAAFLWE